MAWRTVGTSNEDMCQKLGEIGVIKDETMMSAFLNVDRGLFAFGDISSATPDPEIDRTDAYMDRPLRFNHIHQSAPHMYVSVLEALEIHRGGISFLNIGSGSGYLTALVAYLAGPKALCHGIDIDEDVVNHSREVTKTWIAEQRAKLSKTMINELKSNRGLDLIEMNQMCCTNIEYVHGNCFNLSPSPDMIDIQVDLKYLNRSMKYDRIYIGAACSTEMCQYFRQFLHPNGILVVPLSDESQLVKIYMNSDLEYVTSTITSASFRALRNASNTYVNPRNTYHTDDSELESDEHESDNNSNATSDEANVPNATEPLLEANDDDLWKRSRYAFVMLPKTPMWSPQRHYAFPDHFRSVIRSIVCSRPLGGLWLPVHLKMHIFTFLERDWFVCVNEQELLKRDLHRIKSINKTLEEKNEETLHSLRRAQQQRNETRMALSELQTVAAELIRENTHTSPISTAIPVATTESDTSRITNRLQTCYQRLASLLRRQTHPMRVLQMMGRYPRVHHFQEDSDDSHDADHFQEDSDDSHDGDHFQEDSDDSPDEDHFQEDSDDSPDEDHFQEDSDDSPDGDHSGSGIASQSGRIFLLGYSSNSAEFNISEFNTGAAGFIDFFEVASRSAATSSSSHIEVSSSHASREDMQNADLITNDSSNMSMDSVNSTEGDHTWRTTLV